MLAKWRQVETSLPGIALNDHFCCWNCWFICMSAWLHVYSCELRLRNISFFHQSLMQFSFYSIFILAHSIKNQNVIKKKFFLSHPGFWLSELFSKIPSKNVKKMKKTKKILRDRPARWALAGRTSFPDAISEGFLSSCFCRSNWWLHTAVHHRTGIGRASCGHRPEVLRKLFSKK